MINLKKIFEARWISLIFISVISITVNQLLFDTKAYLIVDTTAKDIMEILLIYVIMAIGNWGLKRSSDKWPQKAWKFIYRSGIFFFLIMSIIDRYIYHYSISGQFRFLSIKQIYWSPLIYIVLIPLDYYSEKHNTTI